MNSREGRGIILKLFQREDATSENIANVEKDEIMKDVYGDMETEEHQNAKHLDRK